MRREQPQDVIGEEEHRAEDSESNGQGRTDPASDLVRQPPEKEHSNQI
jgi:hypothetical protein